MYEVNGLNILCDWLSFTITNKTIFDFFELFGLRGRDFKLADKGGRGYKRMLRHKTAEITVFYEGNADMGIHCEVKGSGMTDFLESFRMGYAEKTPFNAPFNEKAFHVADFKDEPDFDGYEELYPALFKRISTNGWITRMDIAIDDYGCKYFSCEDVEKILGRRDYVAKFRKWDSYKSVNAQGENVGYTIYCGSRMASDMFLRIYDKRLEQLQKIDGAENPEWTRWEFVLKDERANCFADYIINGSSFGLTAMDLLNGYMRFIVRNDSNTTRCSTLPQWIRFVATVEKLRVTAPKKRRSVGRAYTWLERQCMPTIAGLCMASGGSLDFITENLKEHYERLSKEDKQMYNDYLNGDSDIFGEEM